jgi:hypothetical protein
MLDCERSDLIAGPSNRGSSLNAVRCVGCPLPRSSQWGTGGAQAACAAGLAQTPWHLFVAMLVSKKQTRCPRPARGRRRTRRCSRRAVAQEIRRPPTLLDESTNQLVNASAALVVAICLPTVGAAQDARDAVSLFRELAQSAIAQSTRFEWQKLPKSELACINQALTGRGEIIQELVRLGLGSGSCDSASSKVSPARGAGHDRLKSPLSYVP